MNLFRRKPSFSSAEEIAALGAMAMDVTFFFHLGAAMREAGDKTVDDVLAAIDAHNVHLHGSDPDHAWEYRFEMIRTSTKEWPLEVSMHLHAELGRTWVPTAEDEKGWATLSRQVQESYLRQGAWTMQSSVSGIEGVAPMGRPLQDRRDGSSGRPATYPRTAGRRRRVRRSSMASRHSPG